MKEEIFENDCEANITGYHEEYIKWELPDRKCYACNKCGKEKIILNKDKD